MLPPERRPQARLTRGACSGRKRAAHVRGSARGRGRAHPSGARAARCRPAGRGARRCDAGGRRFVSAGIVAGSGRGPPVQFAFVVALAGDGFSRQVLDLVFVLARRAFARFPFFSFPRDSCGPGR